MISCARAMFQRALDDNKRSPEERALNACVIVSVTAKSFEALGTKKPRWNDPTGPVRCLENEIACVQVAVDHGFKDQNIAIAKVDVRTSRSMQINI